MQKNLCKMGKFRIVLILFVIKLCSTDAEFVNQGSRELAQINICKEAKKGDFPGSELTISSNFSANTDGSSLKFKISNETRALRCEIKNDDDFGSAQNVQSDAQNQNETSPQIFFFDTGILQHKIGEVSTFYEPEDFCLLRLSDRNVEVKVCIADCDPGKKNQKSSIAESDKKKSGQSSGVCIRKCCPPDQVLELRWNEIVCKNSGKNRWSPTFFDSGTLNNFCISQKEAGIESQSGMNRKYRHHIQNRNWSNASVVFPNFSMRTSDGMLHPWMSFRLLEDGRLVMDHMQRTPGQRFSQSRWTTNTDPYCIDGVQNIEENGQLYSGSLRHSAILDLFGEIPDPGISDYEITEDLQGAKHGVNVMYVVVMYISLVPLALTLFAYWITWATENIHGWTLFMHVLSLFFMDFFLGTTYLISMEGSAERNSNSCIAIGVLSHFFFLSTFFWLTMVNLDFWLLFRTLKPSSNRAKGIRRFIGYAVFSWGGPLLIIVIGLILDRLYGNHGMDSDCDIILPNYGVVSCYIHRDAEGAYLYFIIGILVIFNTVFFALTVSALCKFQNKSQKALRGKAKSDAIQAKLLVKLFVVMGVCFSFEFISWLVHMNRDEVELGWVVVNSIIWLARSILIFVIFSCKQKTLVQLRRRCSNYPYIMNVLDKVEFTKVDTDHSTRTIERSNTLKMSTLKKGSTKNVGGNESGNPAVNT